MKRHIMDPTERYNVERWRDLLFIRRILADLKIKPKDSKHA